MKIVDITETIANILERKLANEWKHEAFCDGFTSDTVHMVIDGKRYNIIVKEEKKERE